MTVNILDKIRQRAFEIWEAEGCPDGRDVEHWKRAEAEVAAAEEAQVEAPKAKRTATPKAAKAESKVAGAKPATARRSKPPVKT
jgi:hypothetical protein